ncbi:DinB family protein [Pedobacter boryungensis]
MLNYTAKADAILIADLIKVALPEANKLFSHVLTAQHIWLKRVLNQTPDFGVWEIKSVEDFQAISEHNLKLAEDILQHVSLEKDITYKNGAGDEFTNKVEDILLHICNHSTYHRAQISTMLRVSGYTPPITDYIMLKRTNQI